MSETDDSPQPYSEQIQAQLGRVPDLASPASLSYLREEGPTCLPEVLVILVRQAIAREDVELEVEQAALEALLHPKPGIPPSAPAARILRMIDALAWKQLWGPPDDHKVQEFRAYSVFRILEAVRSTAASQRGWQESFFGRLKDRLKDWRDDFNNDWERRGLTGNRMPEPGGQRSGTSDPDETAEQKKRDEEKQKREQKRLIRFLWGELDPDLRAYRRPDPLNDLWAERVREEIHVAIDTLDKELARTLHLYLAGHPIKGSTGPLPSISAILGITPRAVHARIERAKAGLRTNARLAEFARRSRADLRPASRPHRNDQSSGGYRG